MNVDNNIFFEVTIAVATVKPGKLLGKGEIQQTKLNRPRERLELVTRTIKEKKGILIIVMPNKWHKKIIKHFFKKI
jgi:hypothetical protein